MKRKTKTYFSLFQDGDYLESGLNSTTKKEAVLVGIELVKHESTSPSRLERMSLKDKEDYLAGSCGIIVDEHDEPIGEIEEDHRANQRSPFAPGS